MAEAVIVAAVRSAVGKRNGGLSGVHPADLSAQVLNGLAQRSGIEQPTLSQQLTVLRREELIASRKEGKFVYYRLEHPDVLAVMQTLYGIFCAQGGTHDSD